MFSAPLNLPEGARIIREPLSKEMIATLTYLNEIDETVHECAEHWADDEFDTPDGRRFRLLYDGHTIFSRDRQLNAADRKRLNPFAAVIAELDSNEKPLCFATIQEGDQAWLDLQALHGVKSRLASDPDWGEFPEPSVHPLIQL